MRLTLFFVLLFFTLGGSDASASHAAFGTQVFHHSSKQEIARDVSLSRISIDFDTLTEIFTVDDDIEDNDDKNSLSFKKYKITAGSTLAFSQIFTLSRLNGYRLTAAHTSSSSS